MWVWLQNGGFFKKMVVGWAWVCLGLGFGLGFSEMKFIWNEILGMQVTNVCIIIDHTHFLTALPITF